VIVDVGANIGAYSTWAAAFLGPNGRLVAVEPNPTSFQMLKRSLADVGTNASAFQCACGAEEGELPLFSEPGYTVSSSLTNFAAATRTDVVQIRRLDDLLDESDVADVDLLKIDVEGAELLVLAGGLRTLKRTRRVVLETTEGDLGSRIREMLSSAGFELASVEAEHWSISGLEILAFRRAGS
jgi:FkbM family methyltransferase